MIYGYAGLLAGLIHVLSGPDHLAAVAPYAVKNRRQSLFVGLLWGLGHASGVTLVGFLALLLRGILPLQSLASWGERCIGVVLIAIGLWGLRIALSPYLHAHPHSHNGETHIHFHLHPPGEPHKDPLTHSHDHAPFGIGILHGLAGSSHLWGVLPALALPTRLASAVYLGTFCLGNLLGMIGFALVLGLIAEKWASKNVKVYRGLLGACSLSAIVIGVFWLT